MLQSAALTLTTAANVAFLGSLAVVLVPLVTALVTRRAPSGFVIVGTLLAVVGACFLTGATLAIGAGDALALVSAFGVALHIMSIGYFAPRLSPARYNFVQFAVVTAAAAVVATIGGFGHLTTGAIVTTAACGVVQAVGLALQVTGQRRISATSSALILMLIPLTGAVLDVIVNGVSLSPLATLGAALVLGSVVVGELLPGRASGRRAGSASGRRAGSASGRRAGSASGRRAGAQLDGGVVGGAGAVDPVDADLVAGME
jgi:drug/metabolite transporter (DMT)-like permease